MEREHFDKIAGKYADASATWASLYAQIARYVDPLIDRKTVLDVGSGGIFAYDPALAKRVILMDISPKMLDGISHPKVEKLVGDARVLLNIEDSSVDVIVFSLVLHHINGPSVAESLDTLAQVLRAAAARLR